MRNLSLRSIRYFDGRAVREPIGLSSVQPGICGNPLTFE